MSSDIQTTHFLFRHTPPKTHPYIKLMRLDRPIGTWLLLLPCWWSLVLANRGVYNMSKIDWFHVLLFAIGALLMRGAGCVINDLKDRDIDRQVARTKTRPLASGEVTPKQALVFLAILLFVSLLILLAFKSMFALIVGASSLALVVLYPFMKHVTWWPQLFLGLAFNWGALMGFAVAKGTLDAPAFLLYFGGICWTLAYDTLYAHQDLEDDKLVGVKSTARLFGDNSKYFVTLFYGIALTFIVAAKFWASPSIMTPLLCLPALGYIFWVTRKWNPADPASCLAMFRSNRDFGFAVLVMLAL